VRCFVVLGGFNRFCGFLWVFDISGFSCILVFSLVFCICVIWRFFRDFAVFGVGIIRFLLCFVDL